MAKRDERWERIRAKGKWPFIFKFGVLFWGVLTAIGFSIVLPLVSGKEGGMSFLTVLPGSMVVFPLGGLAWGAIMWAVFEAGYRKRKTSEPSAAGDEATTRLRT